MFNRAPDSPEYAAARDKLNSFVLQSAQMEKAVNAMTSRLKSFAQTYNQFASKIFATWLPEAPPAVAQADEVVQKNGATFETLVDTLINQIGPQFFNLLTVHDAQVKELQALEKKRLNLLREMEKKDQALKSQQGAKEPIESKIQAAQVQYDQAKSQFDETNAQFLEQVSSFGEKRNVKLLETFQNFMAIFCQLINQASLLQPIDFPEDQNAEAIDIPVQQPVKLPPSNPSPAPTPTPDQPQPQTLAPTEPPAEPPAPAQQAEIQPVDSSPQEPYNPPASEPAQPEQTYNDTSYNNTTYNDTSYNNTTYNDTSYNNTTYNDTSYNNTTYNDTSYTQQSYNQPAQPDATSTYSYDAPADNQPAHDDHQSKNPFDDDHQTKNPFDEDEDGWGANPFG